MWQFLFVSSFKRFAFRSRRRQPPPQQQDFGKILEEIKNNFSVYDQNGLLKPQELNRENVRPLEEIGKGAFGSVHKVRGKGGGGGGGRKKKIFGVFIIALFSKGFFLAPGWGVVEKGKEEGGRGGGGRLGNTLKKIFWRLIIAPVSKGLFMDPRRGVEFIVAIKTLHDGSDAARDEMMREAAIMAQFKNEHVMKLIGFAKQEREKNKKTTGRRKKGKAGVIPFLSFFLSFVLSFFSLPSFLLSLSLSLSLFLSLSLSN